MKRFIKKLNAKNIITMIVKPYFTTATYKYKHQNVYKCTDCCSPKKEQISALYS